MDRREKLLDGLDLRNLLGAEIGPLASPVVSKDDGPVIYIDHVSTDTLKKKFHDHPGVDEDAIVDIDALWGDNTIEEALGSGNLVDYVIASHVVEHVPDFIGWLVELASVLKPGGSIRLAVPDRHFCFDIRRQDTRLSDILAAYLARARRPRAHEIIDFEIYHTHLDLETAWDDSSISVGPPGPEQLKQAFDAAKRSLDGEYVDVHCWTFTLASFAGLMQHLAGLGLTDLACLRAFDTEVYEHEFFVLMTRASRTDALESWRRVYEEAEGTRSSDLETWPEARRRWLLVGRAAEIANLRREMDGARRQLAEMRNSTSWRITGPLRAAAQRLRGLLRPSSSHTGGG